MQKPAGGVCVLILYTARHNKFKCQWGLTDVDEIKWSDSDSLMIYQKPEMHCIWHPLNVFHLSSNDSKAPFVLIDF